LDIVHFRPFFLIGPRKVGDVSSDFARQIASIEQGLSANTLKVGGLNGIRDFLDVRDGVSALLLLCEKAPAGESYNICSGRGLAVSSILNRLLQISSVPISVVEDPAKLRSLEASVRIGSNRKLSALGWSERFSVDEALGDTLRYWRVRV